MQKSSTEPDKPVSLSEQKARALSGPDPADAGTSNHPPVLLIIIIVLLVTGFVVLHLTGVLGPGSH